MITSLKENEIFIYGSNLAGINAGGAAKYAQDHFGAAKVGSGLSGKQCYAFPTLDKNFKQRTEKQLKQSVKTLYIWADRLKDFTFLLTPVGQGIAGYSKEFMEKLFVDMPKNIKKVNW